MVAPKEAGVAMVLQNFEKIPWSLWRFFRLLHMVPEELLFYKMPPTQGIEFPGSAPYS